MQNASLFTTRKHHATVIILYSQNRNFPLLFHHVGKQVIKHLHQDTLEAILYLFNFIWQTGLPKSWKEAIVIPVLKQGRDPGLPSSYMPIALTSCLCKLLEKMINWRLLYFLEFHGLLDNHQSGFQVHRNLVTFESYVRTRHFCSQTCMSVFIDFIL